MIAEHGPEFKQFPPVAGSVPPFPALSKRIPKTDATSLALPDRPWYTPRDSPTKPSLPGMAAMKVILDAEQIEEKLRDLAEEIATRTPAEDSLAIIGIRSRGEILAQRLATHLSQQLAKSVPCGTLDITLYRDDLNSPRGNGQPLVRTTEIGFDIDDKTIILVDDVLHTGRSTRAALDALIDLGRPKAIRLAVLVERAGREFPIQADYAGYKADVEPGQSVQVNLIESDGRNEVVVE